MWIGIEWLGTILALSGAVIMASKKFNHIISWIFWILSNFLFIALFIHTKQLGLLFMQIAGLGINILGFYQWYTKHKSNKFLANILYILSMSLLSIATIVVVAFILKPGLQYVEWIGSLLAISAALLISSYHRHAKFCWLIWLFANFILLILTIYTKQYGIMTLQIGFSLTNIYGTWNWIFKKKKEPINHPLN